jgi:hypothetical protein
MSIVTILLGSLAIIYGAYVAWVRQTQPAKLGKMLVMQERLGAYRGFWIHVMAYTVAPIVLGIALVLLGVSGGSIF